MYAKYIYVQNISVMNVHVLIALWCIHTVLRTEDIEEKRRHGGRGKRGMAENDMEEGQQLFHPRRDQ